MDTRKRAGKKVKTLPAKPLSDAGSKKVKGGGFTIGGSLGGIIKTVPPTLPPPPPPTK